LKFFFSLQGRGKKEEFQRRGFKCNCPAKKDLADINGCRKLIETPAFAGMRLPIATFSVNHKLSKS
jgi:hypothetical protein